MKRFALLLTPLMAITFLTNCGGPKLYTVSFDSNMGTPVPSQKVEANKYAVKPTDPTREEGADFAYVFKEWQLDGVKFDFATKITKDITLKAEWTTLNKYTVSFDTGKGGSPVGSQKVIENHLAVKPKDPTHYPSESTTFTFGGWKKDDGSIFDFEHTPITEDITLTAIWNEAVREYDITFKPGEGKWKNGSTDPIVKKVKYGYSPDCEAPVKSSDEQYDYLFSGWTPKIEKVTGSSPKIYTARFDKLEKNTTNLVVDFPNDADNKTIKFRYEGTLDSVDWGDAQTSNDGESSHEYKNIGKYTINIHGDLKSFSLAYSSGLYSNGNKYVTNIKLKNGITSINACAFRDCSSLTSIALPSGIVSIGTRAFGKCSSIASITIPNSVTAIGPSAFIECSFLSSIHIPFSVTSIGDSAFTCCSSLNSITVDPNNPNYDSRENCNAIISTKDNTLLCGCMNTKIPNGVTAIGYKAFLECSKLTSIKIPNSVTLINAWAFSKTSLTSIFIPKSVITMDANVFNGCAGLTEIRCQYKESEKPAGWNAEWKNGCNAKVIWGAHQLTNDIL